MKPAPGLRLLERLVQRRRRAARLPPQAERITSYSQLGEDVFLFQNFINVPRSDAILFEVGAYDGSTYSNTRSLELFHRCRCVLIEPSRRNVEAIYRSRPNASVHRLAVALEFGVAEFLGDAAVSGTADLLTPHYIERWGLGQAQRFKVLTAPMQTIIDVEGVDYIDFMSIDVQGGELNVLRSMNWTVPVGIVCIELEAADQKRDDACRALLRERGFVFERRLHISEFWRNPAYERAGSLFDESRRMPFDSFDFPHFDAHWREVLRRHFY